MRKSAALLTIITLAACALPGCTHLSPAGKPDTAAKAAADNSTKTAPPAPLSRRGPLTGMLEGGLLGGGVGRYADEEARAYAQAARDYGYTAAQGTLLILDSVRANPAIVAPGDPVNVNAEYGVLLPEPGKVLTVVETREFLKDGATAGKVSIEVDRAAGGYFSTVPFTIPSGAAAGNYQVVVTIESKDGTIRDRRETFFKVSR